MKNSIKVFLHYWYSGSQKYRDRSKKQLFWHKEQGFMRKKQVFWRIKQRSDRNMANIGRPKRPAYIITQ